MEIAIPIARWSTGDSESGSSSGLDSWPWLRLPIRGRTVTSLQPGSSLQRRDRTGFTPDFSIELMHLIALWNYIESYRINVGATYVRANNSCFKAYRPLASLPNILYFLIKSSAFFSSSPCSLTNQSKHCIVR